MMQYTRGGETTNYGLPATYIRVIIKKLNVVTQNKVVEGIDHKLCRTIMRGNKCNMCWKIKHETDYI